MKGKTIPGLSFWEPWGTLVAIKAKRIETRGRRIHHRGPLVIHTAKRWQVDDQRAFCADEPFRSVLEAAGYTVRMAESPRGWAPTCNLPLGCLIAVVTVADCVPVEELWSTLSEQERAFGNYKPGRFGVILERVERLPEPIPFSGQQGFFPVSVELLRGTSYAS